MRLHLTGEQADLIEKALEEYLGWFPEERKVGASITRKLEETRKKAKQ